MAAANQQNPEAAAFTIFRAESAPSLGETDAMSTADISAIAADGLQKMTEAGLLDGGIVKTLFCAPGFSLIYAWLKSDYPLPLHTHDSNCLYYTVAGGLRLGTENLGAGDGFFVPAGTPYTYTPLENGVEVLEFRREPVFNIEFMAKNPDYWSRAVETVLANRAKWQAELPPSQLS